MKARFSPLPVLPSPCSGVSGSDLSCPALRMGEEIRSDSRPRLLYLHVSTKLVYPVHTHAHTHTHTHAHTHTHKRARTHIRARAHTHTHTQARAHTHTRARTHTHTHTCTHMHARTHKYIDRRYTLMIHYGIL